MEYSAAIKKGESLMPWKETVAKIIHWKRKVQNDM